MVKRLALPLLVRSMLVQICVCCVYQCLWFYAYIRSNRILLDDCLAAVDSHVARHIFGILIHEFSCSSFSLFADRVIGPYGLLSTKARLLVTNGITFIKHFDSLLYIRRGIILERGSYHNLVANPNSEILKLVQVLFLFRLQSNAMLIYTAGKVISHRIPRQVQIRRLQAGL